MSDMNRVQRWRQQQREAGKSALTIWLPRELKLYLEDMALKRHCSPSDLIQQALTTCYPLSADVTGTVTDTNVTDTTQLRLMLQQELRAFWGDTPPYQRVSPVHPVTVTVADTHAQTKDVTAAAPETRHVTDTVTDTLSPSGLAPCVTDAITATETVTETVTVAGQALEPFDTTRYYLGKLCPKGHDFQGTGQSLLRKHNQHCRACENEGKRARRQARRQAPAL